MKHLHVLFLCSISLTFIFFSPFSWGSSLMSFPHRIFASEGGDWGFKVLPNASLKTSEGYLFDIGNKGEERVWWRRELLNIPAQAWVYSYQQNNIEKVAVVTVGDLFNTTSHWLVIYGPSGELIKDYALDELLTPKELKRFQPLLSTGPTGTYDWADEALSKLKLNRKTNGLRWVDAPELLIYFPGTVHLSIDLLTGRRKIPPMTVSPPRVSMVLHNAPLEEALAALFSFDTSAGYVLDKAVTQANLKVTTTIQNMPFDAALNSILRNVSLRASRSRTPQGSSYRIMMRQPDTAVP